MIFKRKKDYWVLEIFFLLNFGLLALSQGKLCPEISRPHLTRCDKYYRCVILQSKSYVWIPAQCERGLIYEPSLKSCVLPGENWECNLADDTNIGPDPDDRKLHADHDDDKNVYGVNNIPLGDYSDRSEEDMISVGISDSAPIIISDSDDGLDVLNTNSESDNELDNFSGDSEILIENKHQNDVSIPSTSSSDLDNTLKSHLQRLSQLIDNLKEQHENRTGTDMNADQLNSYLASHNMLTTQPYQIHNFNSPNKVSIPSDEKLDSDLFNEIIRQQNKLTYDDVVRSTIGTPSSIGNSFSGVMIQSTSPMPPIRASEINESLVYPMKSPNVKLEFKSESPLKGYRRPDYQSTSHIIVNRPGGSLMFNVDSNNNNNRFKRPDYQYHETGHRHEPYISEETLKTVLELSKQLIENQNIRQVYPQQVVKPIIYSFPVPVMSAQYYNHDDGDKENFDPSDKSPHIKTFVNNLPVRRKVARPTEPTSIPITVTNSFNTYKDLEKSSNEGHHLGLAHMGPHGPQNNISTTVIFDRNYSPSVNEPGLNHHTKQPTLLDSYGNHYYSNQNNDYFPTHDANYPSYYSSYQSIPQQYNPAQNYYYNPGQGSSSNGQFYQNPTMYYNNIPTNWGGYNQVAAYGQQSSLPQQYNGKLPQNSNQFFQNQPSSQQKQMPSNNQPLTMHVDDGMGMDDDGDDDGYVKNNNNNQIVTHALTTETENVEQPSHVLNLHKVQSSSSTSLLSQIGGLLADEANDQNKMVNFGGSFVSYEKYKKMILPLLAQSSSAALLSESDLEVVTCVSGVRQHNQTDCTKYYVCNPNNRQVLPYSCPPYTAFSKDTKICDAKTYAFCKPEAIINRFTIAENIKVHREAQQALEEAKRMRQEALKAQSVANLIKIQSQEVLSSGGEFGDDYSVEKFASTSQTPQRMTTRRRRIRCPDIGKISDPDDFHDYWVCFRGKDNRMKRQKLTCSAGLIFCKSMRLCTVPNRCIQ